MSGRARCLVVLLAILVLEVGWAAATHRPKADLDSLAALGDGRDQVYALHVLASRGVPRVFSDEDVHTLLASDDPLVREFVVSPSFRAAVTRVDVIDAYVASLPDTPEGRRTRFLYAQDRGRWMTLDEFRGFLADRE